MTDMMSVVTDETTGTDVNDKPASTRPSRLAERRAIRAASPARAAVSELAESGALDGLFAKIDGGELDLTGDGGFVNELLKASLERGLAVELTDHLGYEKGAPDAAAFPNARNGTTPKTLATQAADVDLAVPRDRDGTFSPRLVPKGVRRRERAKDKGKPSNERKAAPRLVEGLVVTNRKQALAQLAIAYPDRINPHL